MPLPLRSLRAVEIEFRGIPSTVNITDPDHFRVQALVALNHVGSLGRLLSFVSLRKIQKAHFEEGDFNALLEELEEALFTVGELQHTLCDTAYYATQEMFDLLTNADGVDSAA